MLDTGVHFRLIIMSISTLCKATHYDLSVRFLLKISWFNIQNAIAFQSTRLCAIKDDVKGVFSPEASVQTPCAAPSTPVPPYPANKTKTNFLLKWTVSTELCSVQKHVIVGVPWLSYTVKRSWKKVVPVEAFYQC